MVTTYNVIFNLCNFIFSFITFFLNPYPLSVLYFYNLYFVFIYYFIILFCLIISFYTIFVIPIFSIGGIKKKFFFKFIFIYKYLFKFFTLVKKRPLIPKCLRAKVTLHAYLTRLRLSILCISLMFLP